MLEQDKSSKTMVAKLVALGRQQIETTGIVCVANLNASDQYQSEFDRSSEYFTESELDEIVSAFREAGFFTDTFVGERSFINWVEGNGPSHFARQKFLVYNTAQSGTGPGRKSLIPAFSALHGIGTLNADAYAVSLARQKYHVYSILRTAGLPVPETYWYFGNGKWLGNRCPDKRQLVIAKSSYESASIGISQSSCFPFSTSAEAYLDEVSKGLLQPVLVQEFIEGREAETPVVCFPNSPLALEPVGVSIDGKTDLGSEFLHYERVSQDDYGFYNFQTKDTKLIERLKVTACSVADTLQLSGFARVDVRIPADGNYKVTDVATTPHLVAHSAYGHRFKDFGGRSSMAMAMAGLATLV